MTDVCTKDFTVWTWTVLKLVGIFNSILLQSFNHLNTDMILALFSKWISASITSKFRKCLCDKQYNYFRWTIVNNCLYSHLFSMLFHIQKKKRNRKYILKTWDSVSWVIWLSVRFKNSNFSTSLEYISPNIYYQGYVLFHSLSSFHILTNL